MATKNHLTHISFMKFFQIHWALIIHIVDCVNGDVFKKFSYLCEANVERKVRTDDTRNDFIF